ncbi:tRNA-splicing endonuclease subunit sen54 [Haplosporangium gracile]|nr:tRNA-splicing endonuclease subunit sen54 [Haplosporangium gracile]
MNADDQDDQDQQPDFRLLLSTSKGASQALPSRDAKAAQDPETVLKEQYDAFFQVISEERRLQEKTLSRAVYEPELGLFRLTVNKGNHFVSMGHTLKGNICLYPEEALYLVDRSSLLVEHNGTDFTVQQTWNLCLSQSQDHTGQWDSTQAMDRYLAYAYLKRLGYVVTRPGTYDPRLVDAKPQVAATPASSALSSDYKGSWLSSFLWRLLVDSWNSGTRIVFIGLRRWFEPLSDLWNNRMSRPLVANNEQLSHEQILQRISIIPTRRLVQPQEESINYAEHRSASDTGKQKVDFEVYKPAGAFKKRQPGIPDYRVVVVSARSRIPTLEELGDMLQGLVDPAQAEPSSTPSNSASAQSTDKGKKKQQPDWPKVLFAVVDGGQVSFMSLSNVQASL